MYTLSFHHNINTHWMYTMIDGWPWSIYVSLSLLLLSPRSSLLLARPPILVSSLSCILSGGGRLCCSGGTCFAFLTNHFTTNRISAAVTSFHPFIVFVESIRPYFCPFRLFQHGKSFLVRPSVRPKHLLLMPLSTS